MIRTIDDVYFKEYISSTSTPIIVDFWTEWCGPCKIIAPILEELDKDYGETLQIAKLNVDFNHIIPVQYEVRSVPTLLIFKEGVDLGRIIGAVNKKSILDKLDSFNLL